MKRLLLTLLLATTWTVQADIKPDLNLTVVAYYDLLGREVDSLEPYTLYVVLYSNGHRQKVMRTK